MLLVAALLPAETHARQHALGIACRISQKVFVRFVQREVHQCIERGLWRTPACAATAARRGAWARRRTGRASIQLTLAGPGSGKTSTLTGRFVHIIRQGVDPARILAVTFTKKAADEMRRRIVRLLELPSPSSLRVMTFHAFAFRQLRRNPGMAGLPERFQFWDAAEQRQVFSSRRMWWNESPTASHRAAPRFAARMCEWRQRFVGVARYTVVLLLGISSLDLGRG
jgi:hypothetical protein